MSRIALLDRSADEPSRVHAAAMRDAGHDVQVLGSHAFPPVEALLRMRGFTAGITHIPAAAAALGRGGFDLAHAFTVEDAVAAVAMRGRSGRPIVFTCIEPPARRDLADGRLRLWMVRKAFEGSDVLVAADEAVQAAIERWLALGAELIVPGDAASHERLYRGLIARHAG